MTQKRILIVDDEIGFTEMVKINLEAAGNNEVCIENHCGLEQYPNGAAVPDVNPAQN